MCLTPISIPNNNYKVWINGHDARNPLKDCSNSRLLVPCGHCAECVYAKQSSIAQRCVIEEKDSYAYMCMLSYNNPSLPTVLASDGKRFKYAQMSDLQTTMKHVRLHDAFTRPFRYFAVTEFGSDESRGVGPAKHRPHFHLLIFLPKYPGDDPFVTPLALQRVIYINLLKYWRRNYGSRKYPLWRPLCTPRVSYRSGIMHRNYDVTYCDPREYPEGVSGSAIYVSKYYLKDNSYVDRLQKALKLNYSPEEYKRLWQKVHPRTACSRGFGLSKSNSSRAKITPDKQTSEYIKRCIKLSLDSKSDKPLFFDRANGRPMPMSPVYVRRFVSPDDQLAFLINRDPDAVDGSFTPEYDVSQDLRRRADSVRKTKLCQSRGDVLHAFEDSELDADPGSLVPDMPQFVPENDFPWDTSDFVSNDLPDFDSIQKFNQDFHDALCDSNQVNITNPIIKTT